MECKNCAAKRQCLPYTEPESYACLGAHISYNRIMGNKENQMFYYMKLKETYCLYCGNPLKVAGKKKFCNNPSCQKRFVDI